MSTAALVRRARRFAFASGILVFTIGGVVLCGRLFNFSVPGTSAPGGVQMSASTALGFLLAGIGLCCAAGAIGSSTAASQSEPRRDWRLLAIWCCGLAVTGIGLMKVSAFAGLWSSAGEQLWLKRTANYPVPLVVPATTVNFVLVGCALILAGQRRFMGAFQTLALLGGLIGWIGLGHFIYGGVPLVPYAEMSIYTALAFIVLSAGLLGSWTEGGLMALIISPGLGGEMIRRLVPAVVVFPILFGWLRLVGQRAGWFGTEAGVALFALANVVVFGGLIWFNAKLLERSDHSRKLAEENIQRLNAELEVRVQNRTAELIAANQEMESFTYSVAHDLRAPLRHIDAFARILTTDHGDRLTAEAQDCLVSISRASATMSRLVDDLLKLARLVRHEIKRELTPLDPMVEEVVAELKGQSEGRQIEWRIQRLPAVECDPHLMKLVFENLLSNAFKYTRSRSQALIEVGWLNHHEHKVIFVRDNGVGFDMAYADKLFGVFQRLHQTEEFEGTGVGLAATERIVRRHGGRIWAEGAIEQGATFYFTVA